MNVLLGFHQGHSLGLHSVNTRINRVGSLGRGVVFDLVFSQKAAEIRTDGAGRIGHDEHGAAF
jgi:hypothetical protein